MGVEGGQTTRRPSIAQENILDTLEGQLSEAGFGLDKKLPDKHITLRAYLEAVRSSQDSQTYSDAINELGTLAEERIGF